MNLYMFIKTAIVLYKELEFQKKYINDTVKPYLISLEEKYKGSFTPYQRSKIFNSYCLYVPIIVSLSINKLIGQSFPLQHRKSSTMMGLLTPLYDDLFDELNLDTKEIQQLTINPNEYQTDIFLPKVVKEIGMDLINVAADKNAYLKASEEVLQIQVDTMQQFNPNTSSAILEKITWNKAMISFVYYYSHPFGNPSEEMKQALYEVGGLQQFCNDLFDMYKDCKTNNYTLANTCKDFTELKKFFFAKNKVMFQKVMALPYPKKDKAYFLLRMLSIISSGLVAIDYMIKLENKRGKNIDWFKVERKDLIIDMAKPWNLLLWLLSFRQLIKLGNKYVK